MEGLKNKASFVRAFGVVLHDACKEVEKTDLIDKDTAIVTFKGGQTRMVNIACDSNLAIMKDIIRAVE